MDEQPQRDAWVPGEGSPDLVSGPENPAETIHVDTLTTEELIAACENDTDTYADAGKVIIPDALAELRTRTDDKAAQEWVAKLEAAGPLTPDASPETDDPPAAGAAAQLQASDRQREYVVLRARAGAHGDEGEADGTDASAEGSVYSVVGTRTARDARSAAKAVYEDKFSDEENLDLIAVPKRMWTTIPIRVVTTRDITIGGS